MIFRYGKAHTGNAFADPKTRFIKVAGAYASVAGRWVKSGNQWLRYWPPTVIYNGYVVSTYTSTYNCGTATWSTPTLVSTTVVDALPVGVNTWAYTTSLNAQGVFSSAAGTGDFNGLIGSC